VNKLKSELKKISNKKIKYEVEFFSIIVSSLATIPKFSVTIISRILRTNKRAVVKLWIKIMVAGALKNSLRVWLRENNKLAMEMKPKKKKKEIEENQ
jgi:hypothetical protein